MSREHQIQRDTLGGSCVPVACKAQHGPVTWSGCPDGGQRAHSQSQEHKTRGGVWHLPAESRSRDLGVFLSQHQHKPIGYLITASAHQSSSPSFGTMRQLPISKKEDPLVYLGPEKSGFCVLASSPLPFQQDKVRVYDTCPFTKSENKNNLKSQQSILSWWDHLQSHTFP